MDWQRWASEFENARGPDQFAALFAEGGLFCDPVTPWTADVKSVAEGTDRIFPDWKSRVDRIRGGAEWAVFEWTGTGTFGSGDAGSPKVAIVMEGATIVEVDEHGKVTRWRDYLDTNDPMQQIQAAQAST
jgi:limonene-1,2-epoxide hydrolase